MVDQLRGKARTAGQEPPSEPMATAPARRRRAAAAAPEPSQEEQLVQELSAALEKVRVGLDAAMMRFSERVGGELDRVRGQLTSGQPPARKVLERIKARLEEVRLKPQRGRVKDFARLEDLAEDLADLLPPALSD